MRTELTFYQCRILHFKFLRTIVERDFRFFFSPQCAIHLLQLSSSIFPKLLRDEDLWCLKQTWENRKNSGLGFGRGHLLSEVLWLKEVVQHSRVAACLCFYGFPTSYIWGVEFLWSWFDILVTSNFRLPDKWYFVSSFVLSESDYFACTAYCLFQRCLTF